VQRRTRGSASLPRNASHIRHPPSASRGTPSGMEKATFRGTATMWILNDVELPPPSRTLMT